MKKAKQIIKSVLHEIIDMYFDIFYDHKKGFGDTHTFSIGRTSWIWWASVTTWGYSKRVEFPVEWYLVGLALLGYCIGTKYIITKFSAGSKTIRSFLTDEDREAE
jgi:hypothetical protein